MRLLYPIILFSAFSLLTCEKEELSADSDARLPVVEGYLTANEVPEIKVFRQLPFEVTTDELLPIEDLSPQLLVDNNAYSLEPQPDGTYRAGADVKVQSSKRYQLSFLYDGRVVSAATEVPAAPVNFSRSRATLNLSDFPFSSTDPITLRWDNPGNDYFQVLLEYAETDTLELSLFAGITEGEGPQISNLPQQTNSFDIRPFNVQYVGTYRAILYRVTADYVRFAEDTGGTSVNLTSPFTNLENGLGIFTGIAADTLTFEVLE